MIYLNNRLVPRSEAAISVFDHGFLYGDGIYETMRAYKGTVFMIDEHIDRLFSSASRIGLAIGKKRETIKKAVYETLSANRSNDAVIRITVSRGPGPLGLDPALCRKPTFLIFASKFKDYPGEYREKGVKIIFTSTRRNYNKALDPQIKSLNFLNNILAKIEAKKEGAFEAVMPNYRGYVAEGTVSNIFFVKDDVLYTPSLSVGILNGITRGLILDIAKGLNIRTREGNYRPQGIYRAQEVFLTNTTMEVMAVTKIHRKTVSRRPGKITRLIHSVYARKVNDYIKENAL